MSGFFFQHFLKTHLEKNSENLKTQPDFSENSAKIFSKTQISGNFCFLLLNKKENTAQFEVECNKKCYLRQIIHDFFSKLNSDVFKTPPEKIKTQFSGNWTCVLPRTSVEKKACLKSQNFDDLKV